MKNIQITNADGTQVNVHVSDEIADFMQMNDREIERQIEKDKENFQLCHFDKSSWENMDTLATAYSAEEICLHIPEDEANAEYQFYANKLEQ